MWVNLLDKDGFIQFKLSHFYIDWSSVFSVSLNLKELLWNKEIRFYSSVQLCFPFFCLSLPHTSFLKNFNHESTLFRLFPFFSWHICENNEVEGTCFLWVLPCAHSASLCMGTRDSWPPPAPRLFGPPFPVNRWPYRTRAHYLHKTEYIIIIFLMEEHRHWKPLFKM